MGNTGDQCRRSSGRQAGAGPDDIAAMRDRAPARERRGGEIDHADVDEAPSFSGADASAYLMLDIITIGGVTDLTASAALALGHGLPASSHVLIQFGSQLLAAAPGRHVLEYLGFGVS